MFFFVNEIATFQYFHFRISYGDISSATMFQDMNKVIMGGALMFIFMVLVLSKFGWIELRVCDIVSGIGFSSVSINSR